MLCGVVGVVSTSSTGGGRFAEIASDLQQKIKGQSFSANPDIDLLCKPICGGEVILLVDSLVHVP